MSKKTSRGEAQKFYREIVLVHSLDECLFWPFAHNGVGYGRLGRNNRYVHRMVCEHFNGQPPTRKHEAAHSCGNGHLGCVARKHLRWATRSQNQLDRIPHGTHMRGERNRASKIKNKDVITIKSLKGKVKQRELAAMFGVTQSQISHIQCGRHRVVE